jgi:uncharacterized membrane protein (DUF2068 family)
MVRTKDAGRGARKHTRGLLLVGLFKWSKAIFFGAVAAGALHLVNKDVGQYAMDIVSKLPVDPEGRFVTVVMDKVYLIDNHHLRQASLLSFLYACVCVVEGTGLILEKEWAEYFTITLTACALPWEAYGMIHHFSWFKVGFMFLNLVVLGYLVWLVRRMRWVRQG